MSIQIPSRAQPTGREELVHHKVLSIMSAKLPRTVGKPQVYRHLHSSSCVAAKPPKIQPAAPRTAAELGFDKKNADRVPKWEPIDIPFSAQSNIQSGLDRHIRLGTVSPSHDPNWTFPDGDI